MTRFLFVSAVALASIALGRTFGPAVTTAAPGEAKPKAPDRESLIAKLAERVDVEKPMKDVAFEDAVDYFRTKFDLPILIDPVWVKRYGADQGEFPGLPPLMGKADDPESKLLVADTANLIAVKDKVNLLTQQVSLPALKGIKLSTALDHVLTQVDGTYFVRSDHIELLSREESTFRTGRMITDQEPEFVDPLADFEGPTLPVEESMRVAPLSRRALVNVHAVERPLADVLAEVSEQTGANVVLATSVGDQGKQPVTARLTNTPVNAAVKILADSAGLIMLEEKNILYVTSKDAAREWRERARARHPVPIFLSGGGSGIQGGMAGIHGGIAGYAVVDQARFRELEERTKAIEAKLEKALAERRE